MIGSWSTGDVRPSLPGALIATGARLPDHLSTIMSASLRTVLTLRIVICL